MRLEKESTKLADQVMQDLFEQLRPQLQRFKSFEEASKAVEALETGEAAKSPAGDPTPEQSDSDDEVWHDQQGACCLNLALTLQISTEVSVAAVVEGIEWCLAYLFGSPHKHVGCLSGKADEADDAEAAFSDAQVADDEEDEQVQFLHPREPAPVEIDEDFEKELATLTLQAPAASGVAHAVVCLLAKV